MYHKYSQYLKMKYGEKVYKLPINLPLTCPNRDGTKGVGGCIFCSDKGAGFETLENTLSIETQIEKNMSYIGEKYHAKKFIAYFQNFSNTYLPPLEFYHNLLKVVKYPQIVEISISTRPDCILDEHLYFAKKIKEDYKVDILFELGLQTANDHSLKLLNRGHTVSDFILAVKKIKDYSLMVGAHVILGLFCDTLSDVIQTAQLLNEIQVDNVKCHSLFVLKDTKLGELYLNGDIKLKTKEEFITEVITFLEHLNQNITVQRLLGRAPKEDALFENWGYSWRKIHNEIIKIMEETNSYQGKAINKDNE